MAKIQLNIARIAPMEKDPGSAVGRANLGFDWRLDGRPIESGSRLEVETVSGWVPATVIPAPRGNGGGLLFAERPTFGHNGDDALMDDPEGRGWYLPIPNDAECRW